MQQIRDLFERIFAPWQIRIEDEELVIGNKQAVSNSGGWKIKWIMDKDENGAYLEYYAINMRYGHLHGRIYDYGKEERLEVLREYIVYSPSIPGDRERSTQEFEIYNRKLLKSLKERGLF